MVGQRQAVEQVRHAEGSDAEQLLPQARAHEASLARHEERAHRVDDGDQQEDVREQCSEQRLGEAVGTVGDRDPQAVDADAEVVDEEAYVAGPVRHCVEDVREGAGGRKETRREQVGQHRVGVRVGHEVELPRHQVQFSHEDDRWQEVCPEIGRLVGRLEDTAHALLQRAARVAVTGNDELLPEVIRDLVDPVEARARREHDGGCQVVTSRFKLMTGINKMEQVSFMHRLLWSDWVSTQTVR